MPDCDDDRNAHGAPERAFAPANLQRLLRHLCALQASRGSVCPEQALRASELQQSARARWQQ